MKSIPKHLLAGLTLSAAAVLAWAPGEAPAETPPNMLVQGSRIDDIITLDPAEVFEFSGAEVMNNVYDRVTTYEPGKWGELVGGVAESWDVSEDGTEKFLLDGWGSPASDDWGAAWWITDTPAVVAVPLAREGGDVTITIRSRTRFEEPVMQAAMALDVNGTEVGRFLPGVPEPGTAVLHVPPETARHVFRTGFNRVAFRSLGVTPVDPSDARPPGPLARRLGRQVWPVAVYSLDVR